MSRQTRVGLLVTAATLLFVVALFAIANRAWLFRDIFFVASQFNQVAGLRSGAAVQYQGVNVGRVEDVALPETPGAKISVRMAIDSRARHVIRKNTLAQIKTDGLVGNQLIVLVSPPEVGDPIDDSDILFGVDPIDLFEITDRAMLSVQNFEKAANSFDQIMQDVRSGQGTLGRIVYDSTLYYSMVQTAQETQGVMNTLSENAQALVTLAGDATGAVHSILDLVESGEGTIARLLNDPDLYERLISSSDTLTAIASHARVTLSNLEQTSNWGALGAFRFAELMEAAKHNWLFKRYFEERGYMEQAPFEVRERALEETFRKMSVRERELWEWEQQLQAREAALPQIPTSATENEGTDSGSN